MVRFVMLSLAVLVLSSFALVGCESAEDTDLVRSGTMGEAVVCSGCGEFKGTDGCCVEGAEKCDKCGLAKGSPGCCKVDVTGGDVTLCGDCGQVKGSDTCCAADAVACDKCGLAKGSPGCCKMN